MHTDPRDKVPRRHKLTEGATWSGDSEVYLLGYVGDLDVYHDTSAGKGLTLELVVVCAPEKRHGAKFNWTGFRRSHGDLLTPADDDVRLTPMEMCELYELADTLDTAQQTKGTGDE